MRRSAWPFFTSRMPWAQTSTVSQATIGGWWKVYQGGMGNFQFGGWGPTNWTYRILATTNVTQALSTWVQVSSVPTSSEPTTP